MRNLIAMLMLAALPGCAGLALPAPAAVANATVLDERLGIAAETGYSAASTLGNRLSRMGVISRSAFQEWDRKGYAGVLAVRAAYRAGNAASYAAAVDDVKAATAGIGGLVK